MENIIAPGDGASRGGLVGHVSVDDLYAICPRHVFTTAGREVVKNSDVGAAPHELLDEVRPDEPGSAGDEVFGHES